MGEHLPEYVRELNESRAKRAQTPVAKLGIQIGLIPTMDGTDANRLKRFLKAFCDCMVRYSPDGIPKETMQFADIIRLESGKDLMISIEWSERVKDAHAEGS